VTNNNAAASRWPSGWRAVAAWRCRAASWSRSAAACASRRSCRRAGARLVEVGTTNRTRVADFEEVLADGRAKLVLRVHPSNFAQSGFVESPDPASWAPRAHSHGCDRRGRPLAPARCSRRSASGSPTKPMPIERLRVRRRPRDVLRGQARRRAAGRASSPVVETSWSGSGRIPWRARCARTR
jgi:hypothetical protein